MKAVVVSIKDKYAALLQDDGRVIKMKNKNFVIGDVIQNPVSINRRLSKVRALSAVAAALIILVSTGAWAYATPYYYVSVDVNPSVMISANRFERVIKFEGLNEDGEAILANLYLKNKRLEDAVGSVVEQISEAGYFNDSGNIMIATASKDNLKSESLTARLGVVAEAKTLANAVDTEVDAESVSLEMVKTAKEIGISPGKYNIIVNKLGESPEDQKDTSIKELMKRVNSNKKLNKQSDESASEATSAETSTNVEPTSPGHKNNKEKDTTSSTSETKNNGNENKENNGNNGNNGNGKGN